MEKRGQNTVSSDIADLLVGIPLLTLNSFYETSLTQTEC